MHEFVDDLVWLGGLVIDYGLAYADDLTVPQLVLLAIVFHITSKHVWRETPHVLPVAAAMTVLPLYFLHRFPKERDDLNLLVISLFRSLLIYKIVHSITTVAAHIFVMIRIAQLRFELWLILGRVTRSLNRLKAVCEQFRRPPPLVPMPPPPPLPTRAERMRRWAVAAQAEFDSEVTLLNTMPLDEDEREVLILQTKQRLLQKLSELNKA